MSDHAAFLRAILAAPDDDLPRLIMADWLMENGEDDRAEFIRVQCALCSYQRSDGPQPDHISDLNWRRTRGIRDHRRYDALRRREAELLDIAAAADWSGLPAYVNEWWWRRGFVETVRLSGADCVAHLHAIQQQTPLRAVRLDSVPTAGELRRYLRIERFANELTRPPEFLDFARQRWPGVEFELLAATWPSGGQDLTFRRDEDVWIHFGDERRGDTILSITANGQTVDTLTIAGPASSIHLPPSRTARWPDVVEYSVLSNRPEGRAVLAHGSIQLRDRTTRRPYFTAARHPA